MRLGSFLAFVTLLVLACTPDVIPPPPVSDFSLDDETLTWSSPVSEDFAGVLVLRSVVRPPDSRPLDSVAYTIGDRIGLAEVVYVGADESVVESDFGPFCYAIFSFNSTLTYAGDLENAVCATFTDCEAWSELSAGELGIELGERTDRVVVRWENELRLADLPADSVSATLTDGAQALDAAEINDRAATFTDVGPDGEWHGIITFHLKGCDDLIAESPSMITDTEPPAAAADLSAEPNFTSIELSWTEPSDPDFDRIVIRRGRPEPPETSADGELVCDPCESPFVDKELERGVEYGYSAWAYDLLGNESEKATVSVQTRSWPVQYDEQKLRALDPKQDIFFGTQTKISGDTAVIMATQPFRSASSPRTWSLYVFDFDPAANQWRQSQIVRNQSSCQARGLALDANTLMVACTNHSEHVFVYTRSEKGFQRVQELQPAEHEQHESFGSSIAIQGDVALVSSPEDTSWTWPYPKYGAGAVYVFKRNDAGVWQESQTLYPSNLQGEDNFGSQLDISGEYAIIGSPWQSGPAPFNRFGMGAVYIFSPDQTGLWQETQFINASNARPRTHFGALVAISGDFAAATSPISDLVLTDSGYIYASGSLHIFENDGTGLWQEVQVIRASETGRPGQFNVSLAMSGESLLLGSIANGVYYGWRNEIPRDESVYLVQRDANAAWTISSRVQSLDWEAGDAYSFAVAIDGERALVGAYREDGGPEFFVQDSGSAYSFEVPAP